MKYSQERKNEILRLLATEANGDAAQCARLTGISTATLLKWQKEQTQPLPDNVPGSTPPKAPETGTPPHASTHTGNPPDGIPAYETPLPHTPPPPVSGNTTERPAPTPISPFPEQPIAIPRKQEKGKDGTPTCPAQPETPEEEPLPTPADIKHRIIRRVSQLVDTCTDPKKLMDTYEAISKSERENATPKETLFDLLAKKLAEK